MRNAWNIYDKIITSDGTSMQERNINRAKRDYISSSLSSPARKRVTINGISREVLIISSKSMHSKTILSMPDERFHEGDYVKWQNKYWLVTDIDMENEIQYRGNIMECNRTLRWQNKNGDIIERWCASSEKANNTQGISSNEKIDSVKTTFTLYLPLDEETKKIRRYQRFIMDVDLEEPNTYVVTNRNVISSVFDPDQKHGVISLVLSQDERSQDKDNLEFVIADYREPSQNIVGTNCEIQYDGENPSIKAGGSYKTYTAVFYDDDGNIMNDIQANWHITFMPDCERYFKVIEEGNVLKIKAENEPSIIQSQIKIELSGNNTDCSCDLYAKVVYIL